MKTILVTAFGPFGGSGRNSSLDTLNALEERIGDAAIVKAVLPVEYDAAPEALLRLLEGGHFDAVVCFGQAEGRAAVTPEYVAVNVQNGAIPDNAGVMRQFAPCVPGGPDGVFATLPAARIAEALTQRGIPAAVSFTAGTYICNTVFYAAARYGKRVGIPAGFVHLPLSREIAEAEGKAGRVPALEQAVLTDAARVVLESVL